MLLTAIKYTFRSAPILTTTIAGCLVPFMGTVYADSTAEIALQAIRVDKFASPKITKIMTGRQLPFYGDPETLNDWYYVVPGPNGLETFLGKTRRTLSPYYDSCHLGLSTVLTEMNSAVANIQKPENDPIKYGMISLGGLSGVMLSMPRSFSSKLILPLAGILGMYSFCFPYTLDSIKAKMGEELHKRGELTFWFFRTFYCDMMDTLSRIGGQRINLVDGSITGEDDLAHPMSTAMRNNMETGTEAAMSSMVTLLPPPPSLTATSVHLK